MSSVKRQGVQSRSLRWYFQTRIESKVRANQQKHDEPAERER